MRTPQNKLAAKFLLRSSSSRSSAQDITANHAAIRPQLLKTIESATTIGTLLAITTLVVLFLLSSMAHAQNTSHGRAKTSGIKPASELFPGPYRSIDGTGNNIANPLWGSTGVDLLRSEGNHYGDGISTPAGADRPSPRVISDDVLYQVGDTFNTVGASDFVWQWGQFLDHDMDLTNNDTGVDEFDVSIPDCDPFFDPGCTGTQIMPFFRSHYDPNTGISKRYPRQQINEVAGYIDGSQVYGSSADRETILRANDGTGHLLSTTTTVGVLLPYNTTNFAPNACMNNPDPTTCFIAGDIRSNEQVGLTAMHTLFMREHNRLADLIHAEDPTLDDEAIYQNARAIVGAEIQAITYKEFLPIVLGKNALPAYTGYNPASNASVRNMFSTAAYRFGHSMLASQILRLDSNLQVIPQGNLALRDAFFNPQEVINGGGIEPMLRGLSQQLAQDVDVYVVDEVRNFLFGPPGSGGLDLPTLNLQRGRDHGLPSYNQARQAMGLPIAKKFSDITKNQDVQQRLRTAYGSPFKVDLWIGGLAEDHASGALVGPLFRRILLDQFKRSRGGDAFWYENIFSGALLTQLESTTLSQVIHNNTTIGAEIGNDVFHVPSSARVK